jgi:hypothetical protein
VAAVAAALAVALAACSGGGGDDTTASSRRPPKTEGPTTTTAPPVQPLTGLPDPSGDSRSRPVLWVKVDNLAGEGVRPQTGLEVADVVYEEVVERGITRVLAAFNSAVPDVVGPIRSVRLTDRNIVWPLGGIFAYSGGAAPAVDAIHEAPVNAVDESNAGDAMFRDNSKRAPHNLFGRGPALFDKGGDPKPPPPLFQYLPAGQLPVGEPVGELRIALDPGYAPTYTYDGASNTWKRSIDGVAFTTESGEQIAPTNVVIQFVDYVGGVGADLAEGNTVGSGEAWIFTGGQLIRGQWTRPDRTQPAQYLDGAGNPILLGPGRTWVELPQVGTPVDVVPAGAPTG